MGAVPAFGEAALGAVAIPAQPDAAHDPEVTLGQKLGSAILIVNALLVLFEQVSFSELLPKSSAPTNWVVPFIDIGMAIAILMGKRNAVSIAVARLGLGALIFGVMQFSTNGALGLALQLSLSGGVLLLLVGEAKLPRLVTGSALVAGYLTLSLTGLYALKTGTHPLGFLVGALRSDIEGAALAELRDDAAGWRMDWPGEAWRPRKAAEIAKENPLVTQWAVHPRHDAHLLVIAERLPAGAVNITTHELQQVVEENLRSGASSVQVLSVEPLGNSRHLLHVRATVKGLPLEYLIGLLVSGDKAIQVHGFAHEQTFPLVQDELRSAIGSLTVL